MFLRSDRNSLKIWEIFVRRLNRHSLKFRFKMNVKLYNKKCIPMRQNFILFDKKNWFTSSFTNDCNSFLLFLSYYSSISVQFVTFARLCGFMMNWYSHDSSRQIKRRFYSDSALMIIENLKSGHQTILFLSSHSQLSLSSKRHKQHRKLQTNKQINSHQINYTIKSNFSSNQLHFFHSGSLRMQILSLFIRYYEFITEALIADEAALFSRTNRYQI